MKKDDFIIIDSNNIVIAMFVDDKIRIQVYQKTRRYPIHASRAEWNTISY